MKNIFPIFFGVGIFTADFFSKKWAQKIENSVEIFGNFLRFEFHQNSGIAFSIPIPTNFQILFSVIFLGAIGFYFFWKSKDFSEKIFLSAIFFGAIGNLCERIFFGKVTDFVAIWNFPIWNFADAAIFFGVAGILFLEFIKSKK